MMILYGIHSCSTVKKAMAYLQQQQVDYRFHDYRLNGLDVGLLDCLEAGVGWKVLLNRRSTTWRLLSAEQKADLSHDAVMALLLAYPTLIKRPILQINQTFIVGFDPNLYPKKS